MRVESLEPETGLLMVFRTYKSSTAGMGWAATCDRMGLSETTSTVHAG
jgi:hypothetical protein